MSRGFISPKIDIPIISDRFTTAKCGLGRHNTELVVSRPAVAIDESYRPRLVFYCHGCRCTDADL